MENKIIVVNNAVIIEAQEDVEIILRNKKRKRKIFEFIRRKSWFVRDETFNLTAENSKYKDMALSEIHNRMMFR